tara:strand:+ start:588 stop:788 length:201 start_codon:yes stop_codon:yes gene_type:complete
MDKAETERKLRREFRKLIPKTLKSTQSANTISNKDLEILRKSLGKDAVSKYMKLNDGGFARKTRRF